MVGLAGVGVADRSRLRESTAGVCLIRSYDDLPVITALQAQLLPPAAVAAVLDSAAATLPTHALRHGAGTVAATDDRADQLTLALRAERSGISALPLTVTASLAKPADDALGEDEQRWLRALADGETVAHVARRANIGERSLHRHLRRVYSHLGVTSRTEALLEARRRGLL